MTTTTALTGTAAMMINGNGPEAHAVDCGHEGHVLGIMTAPAGGEMLFTGTVADCLVQPLTPATFAAALQEKFTAEGPGYTMYADQPGKKYTRIVTVMGSQRMVHCFVENATGAVYKAAGWTGPAKGVRYDSMEEALAAATWHGSYLYADYKAA